MLKFFTFLLCSQFAFAQNVTFINRELLKVNENSYTQREAEIYLLVKALRKSERSFLAKEANWKRALRDYKNDMLVYEDSRKLRYTMDSGTDFKDEIKSIRKSIQEDKELRDLASRLVISDKDILNALLTLGRVDKYKMDQNENPIESSFVHKSRRVPTLDKKSYVYFYKDAFVYRYIQPNAFKLHK